MTNIRNQQKEIIKQLKKEKLYTTYRAILNVYYNYHLNKRLYKRTLDNQFFTTIKNNDIKGLINYLKYFKTITPKGDKQIQNYTKFYFLQKGKNPFIYENIK